jgi:hypothetical protein
MLQVGVGTSTHRNPVQAGQEAVQTAFASAGIDRCDFVMLFATVGYDQQLLLRTVRTATGGVPLCGCSAEGIIAQSRTDESNHAVVVLVWRSDEIHFHPVKALGLRENSRAVGTAVATALAPLPADALSLFVFADGLTFNFDRFRDGFEAVVGTGQPLPMLGGAAADNWQMRRTFQYLDDEVFSDGVSAALMAGKGRLACHVNHGCVAIGHERTITRCEGNVIYEVDGKPILEVLKEYLDEEEVNDFNKAIVNLCLGFKSPKALEESYDEFIIRFMPSKDDRTGSVSIPTEVTPGTRVWMTRRDPEKMFRGVEQLAERLRAQMGSTPPRAVFHFDCAGRGKTMFREQDRTRLITRLQELVSPTVPWIGFYTYGEIGPVNRQNHFHNYSAVVSVLH